VLFDQLVERARARADIVAKQDNFLKRAVARGKKKGMRFFLV